MMNALKQKFVAVGNAEVCIFLYSKNLRNQQYLQVLKTTDKLCTIFSGCYCDSFVSNVTGFGNCGKSESDGRTLCYVKNPDTSACSDLKDSSTHPDKKWSYKACESATTPNGMYF